MGLDNADETCQNVRCGGFEVPFRNATNLVRQMMELTVVLDGDGPLRLKATGRITPDDATAFADPLAALLGSAGYARRVVMSLEEAEFINSSGISWLLARHRRFREAGGKFVLHSVSPMVLQVIRTLRMDSVFLLADHEPAAVAMIVDTEDDG